MVTFILPSSNGIAETQTVAGPPGLATLLATSAVSLIDWFGAAMRNAGPNAKVTSTNFSCPSRRMVSFALRFGLSLMMRLREVFAVADLLVVVGQNEVVALQIRLSRR